MKGPIAHFRGHVITAVIAILVGLGFFGLLLVQSGLIRPFSDTYNVRALVPTAATIGKGASVRIAGLKVGRVTAVERRGLAAVIDFEVQKEYAPLPADSRVGVRLRTLIGENYLALDPGRSKENLKDGGTLPITRADDYVEVDTILSTLKGPTREHARALLRGLGAGIDGRGQQLNRLLDNTSGLISGSTPLLAVLNKDRVQATRMVDSLGAITRAVADRGAAISDLSRDARTTFTALGARDTALRQTLKELPATLRQVKKTSKELPQTTRVATPVITELAATLNSLQPAIKSLRPATTSGRQLLAEVDRGAAPITGVLNRLRTTATPVAKALPQLKSALCQINPALDYVAPYAPEAAAMFSGLASGVNGYDATGHFGRVYAMVSENSFNGYPEGVSQAANKLLSTGLLNKFHMLGYNPYPDQGTLGNYAQGSGATGPSDVKTPYHRVQAAC